ncbi:MAG: AraC family transcriptional regulator, partial [Campylobacter concisus]|nr:AraC family transcriptional regulator [Campylobacter concisus]
NDKIKEIVEKNIENPDFNIEQLASEVCMGRSAFFEKIKDITGTTPANFILECRLNKATALLIKNPTLRMDDIAAYLGFSSGRYFCKCLYQFLPQIYYFERFCSLFSMFARVNSKNLVVSSSLWLRSCSLVCLSPSKSTSMRSARFAKKISSSLISLLFGKICTIFGSSSLCALISSSGSSAASCPLASIAKSSFFKFSLSSSSCFLLCSASIFSSSALTSLMAILAISSSFIILSTTF